MPEIIHNADLNNSCSPLRSKSNERQYNRQLSQGSARSRHSSQHHTPLRSKSPGDRYYHTNAEALDDHRNISPHHDQSKKMSNADLRNQYYRQINLCKKGGLNWYEASNLIGYLLDLIYQSRKLEETKIKLIRSSDAFNIEDAWRLIEPRAYNPNAGRMTQIDLREGLLRHLMKSEKITMDRIYLLYRRYNTSGTDLLNFKEFSDMICPIDQRESYVLKARYPS